MAKNSKQQTQESVVYEPVPGQNTSQNDIIEMRKVAKTEVPTALSEMSAEQLVQLVQFSGNDSLGKVETALEKAQNFDGIRATYQRTFEVTET